MTGEIKFDVDAATYGQADELLTLEGAEPIEETPRTVYVWPKS